MTHPSGTDTPLRVLYLEDNAADAELTQRTLQRQAPAIAIDIVPTLSAARTRLTAPTPPYDVILSDLRLPDGSGLELLAHVRERQLPAAVIILTGSGDQSSAIAALKAGADDYLIKHGNYIAQLPQTLYAARDRFLNEVKRLATPLRVLYAEHNAFDVDLTRRHFAQHSPHIRIEAVGNAGEAFARLAAPPGNAPPYDVILLDYQLPGANGLEIARTLRHELGLDLPVVLITGRGGEEVVAEAMRLGVADYLIKETGYLNELPATLEQAHRQAQLLREQAVLRQTSERLQHVLATSPTVAYMLRIEDDRFTPQWVSENVSRMLGYTPDDCLQPGWWLAHIHPDDRPAALERSVRLLVDGALAHDYRFLDKNGGVHWIRDELRVLRDEAGNAIEAVGSWSDLTGERQTAERLRLHAAALSSTHDAVFITDLSPAIIAINPAFTEITGYDESEVLGASPHLLSSGRHDRAFYQALWGSLEHTGRWQGEIWNRRRNGEIIPMWTTISAVRNEGDDVTHYVAVASDLSQIKRSEQQLQHLAHYDPLTDLPNRLLLQSHLQHALERAQRQQHRLALLYINLDQFKTINDSLGHTVGDELLIAVARRLRNRARAEDTLGRLGADEFILILEAIREYSEAEAVAQSVLSMLEAPFPLSDGHETYVCASIGISVLSGGDDTAEKLLREADTAMHRAKEFGGHQFTFYTNELNSQALARLEMETALRRACERGEFILHYQPKVNIASGRIAGAEALLRWRHPAHGLVQPVQFISLAEKSGQIVPIGAWVIDEACRQMRAWSDAGLPAVKVAVNVSARQFRSGALETVLKEALEKHAVAPHLLELELTESMLMESPDEAADRLAALKRIGVNLSLDDFGTGYSSLAYLSRFPIDQLKIDRSFVTGIVTDPNAATIATSIISLAHRMQLKVVAEGVEDEAQLGYLRQNNCDEMQGFLFSRPLPAEEFADLVRRGAGLEVPAPAADARTLLLIDDEPNILSAIRRALRNEGYRVLATESAHDALELLATHSVQVVLADQRMPEISGTDLLIRIRALHPDTVRIALTGYTDLESVMRAVNTGALYKFLTKPWEDEQLREHIRDAFRYYEAIVKPRAEAVAIR